MIRNYTFELAMTVKIYTSLLFSPLLLKSSTLTQLVLVDAQFAMYQTLI